MRDWLNFFWAYHIKYKLKKAHERTTMWVAWRLPSFLVMWCAVRVAAHATTGEFGTTSIPDLTAPEALKRWDMKGGGDRRRNRQLS